jgi:hypothetical protein
MTNVPDNENPAVAALRRRKAEDPRALLTRKQCETAGNWGQSTQISKEAAGDLHRVLDGVIVKVTAESFYNHLIALASAPPRKARQPSARFSRRRDPTPQELAGLRRANEARAKEARRRREDKAAAPAE